QALRRTADRDGVTNEDVQLSVAIGVSDPYPRRVGRTVDVIFGQQLPLFARAARFDQYLERPQRRQFAGAGNIFGPVHAAVGRSTEQIQVAVSVPVDGERIAVMALDA